MIPDGYELFVDRSKAGARKALDEAEARGFSRRSVLSTRGGFLVPVAAEAKDEEPKAEEPEAAVSDDAQVEPEEKVEAETPAPAKRTTKPRGKVAEAKKGE